MQFITLTTDMGYRDHYIASLKASILMQIDRSVHLLDITHHVDPFDVVEAAFHVGQAYRSFPPGTVHIIGVDSEPLVRNYSDDAYPSIMVIADQYFVANDNGFFSVLAEYSDETPLFYRVNPTVWKDVSPTFATKNILAPIACQLTEGIPISSFAQETHSFHKAFSPIPVVEDSLIKGIIVHFDSFGNAITNIDQALFERVGKNAPFVIKLRKGDSYDINSISTSYNDVPSGEKLALFNENGRLEIAINKGANKTTGGAQTLFGLNKHDTIRVEFRPPNLHSSIEELLSDS